ncbi:hypothetical protein DUNSADRAFT_8309 [Dunaliella salina]|uniref:Secreted protein n=1 Tax=Dunaliella salina TaxID=3046 RepID=A0ABQ7H610_DUNSA|nr:hypothetical protein DUNSADRAFT_8309 [Dunaliella salina]|eukprot:KAF5842246.1 hypothetical protein DUNSADRAFT_8309 [Dunaliella salina]
MQCKPPCSFVRPLTLRHPYVLVCFCGCGCETTQAYTYACVWKLLADGKSGLSKCSHYSFLITVTICFCCLPLSHF